MYYCEITDDNDDDDLQTIVEDCDVDGDVKVIIVHDTRSEYINDVETLTQNNAEYKIQTIVGSRTVYETLKTIINGNIMFTVGMAAHFTLIGGLIVTK